ANVWNGTVTFAQDPGFGPATTPPGAVAIGAATTASGDQLTINGAVGQDTGLAMGLTKVGPGKVVLASANSYSALTTVAQGTLDIQNNLALGASGVASPPPSPLIHDYELNNTYADSMGGPSLQPNGGTLSSGSYTFGANQGLTLNNALPNPA